jgi:hypothetical protein
MSGKAIICSYAEENDLAARYLRGELNATEVEAFEAHYVGCDRCWAEVRIGGEVREGLGQPFLEAQPASGPVRFPRRDFWTPLAAAAVAVVIAVGVGSLSRRSAEPERAVLRGAATDALDLKVLRAPDGHVVLEWPSHSDARTYVLEIRTSEGVRVLTSESTETRVALNADALPRQRAGASLTARVTAVNSFGHVVARTESIPLPWQ